MSKYSKTIVAVITFVVTVLGQVGLTGDAAKWFAAIVVGLGAIGVFSISNTSAV